MLICNVALPKHCSDITKTPFIYHQTSIQMSPKHPSDVTKTKFRCHRNNCQTNTIRCYACISPWLGAAGLFVTCFLNHERNNSHFFCFLADKFFLTISLCFDQLLHPLLAKQAHKKLRKIHKNQRRPLPRPWVLHAIFMFDFFIYVMILLV